MTVTANLVVNFSDQNAFLEAEINENDNDSKTNFVAGDEILFRIYNSGTYDVTSSAGSVSQISSNNIINISELNDEGLLEQVSFAFSGSASTDKFIYNFISGTWIGKPLGLIKKIGHNELSGGIIKKEQGGSGKPDQVGVAKVNYDTKYDLWKLTSPASLDGSTTYTIVVGITATN